MRAVVVRTVEAQRSQLKLEIIKRDPVTSVSLAFLWEGIPCSAEAEARLQVWSEHTADPELLPVSQIIHPISD